MKRIYLLIAFFALMATNTTVKAQSTDLRLKHAIISDTMLYNGPTAHIIRWRFINNGPTALVQATDTLLLARAYTSGGVNRIRLTLPANGIPVGDSATWADTVSWTSAPGTNPFTWCDTVTVFRSGTLMTDTDPTNNRICKTIPFKQDPASVENVVADNSMRLYPNPATSNLTINYSLNGNADETSIRILSLVGQTVYQQSITDNSAGSKQVNISVANLNSGIYIAELSVNGAKVVNKFSIVK